MNKLDAIIRNIPDYPKPGVQFKDITPLLADPEAFITAIDAFKERYAGQQIDLVVGIEARGFIFASALAYALNAGTCLVRKPGKLPHSVHRQSYELEYGTDTVEIHTDAFKPGQRIIIIDDVLATGGTVAATVKLISMNFDIEIAGIEFLMELNALEGRTKLEGLPVNALLQY